MLIKNSVVTSTVIWDQKQSEIYLIFKNTYNLPYQNETHQSISNTSTKHFYLVFFSHHFCYTIASENYIQHRFCKEQHVLHILRSFNSLQSLQAKYLSRKKTFVKILIFQGYLSVLLLMLAMNLVRNN